MVFNFLHRNWVSGNPPVVQKTENPIRFGILGAAKIAPSALIVPARTHPDVEIYAVAARDREKAETYAKQHGIPVVLDSYEALLENPKVDAVYIALPNGLHLEWALKALRHGKHVLLEKPSVSNAEEAELLFNLPLLKEPNAPILLEAVHYYFDPTWKYFMSQIRPADVVYASHIALAPKGAIALTDIRYNHELSGGAIMDIGSYGISALRSIFASEPEECTECETKTAGAPASHLCDSEYTAKLKFPNGGVGEIHGNYNSPWLKFRLPSIKVEHRETVVDDESLDPSHEKIVIRKVTFSGHMFATMHNRIDTEDNYQVRRKDNHQIIKKWTQKVQKGVHSFHEININEPGEVYWKSYRYQLEQFVNKVRGRKADAAWVSAENSLAQMKAVDMVYQKSGLGLRPTHTPLAVLANKV